MTQDAQDILEAFDALQPVDRKLVAAEIFRRSIGKGELADEAFDELAVDLFHSYEADEQSGAQN